MTIQKIPKIPSLGAEIKSPKKPKKVRKFEGIRLRPKEDPVEKYIEGTDETLTIPERIVMRWLMDQDVVWYAQVSIRGTGLWRSGWGRIRADYVVLGWPSHPEMILRVNGEFFHKSPGRAYLDDLQARRLRGMGYWVVDMWAMDLIRAVEEGAIDYFIVNSINDPLLV